MTAARRTWRGLQDHPGVRVASFLSLIYIGIGLCDGGLRWLWYGLLSLVSWSMVLVTAYQSGAAAERRARTGSGP